MHQVWVPTVMPAAITCLVISGCQLARNPYAKDIELAKAEIEMDISAVGWRVRDPRVKSLFRDQAFGRAKGRRSPTP